ncbi:MMPL family transporter [Aquipuribacter nitratireducens]|uniref:MMPL family transporter n=1 Tax=Aquipuribacter nitratireducens TaxID=650104 RepID=A0ABW0GPZ9_9MICO
MSSFLYAFGRFAHRRWRAVLLVWLLVVAAAGGAAALLSQGTTTSLSIPGTESQAALDRLDATFPQVSGSSVQLVGVATDGVVDDPAVLEAVAGLVDDLEELDEVSAVASPLAEDGSLLPDASGQVSADGDTLLLTAQLDVGRDAVTPDLTDAVLDLAEANGTPAVTWTAGGDAFGAGTPTLGATELVGLGVAAVVLTLTLGSLLAAGMPILTALVGVGTAMALVFAATAVVDLSSTAPLLAVMIGIAVGIDYALFVLARHRDQLGEGMDPEESAGRAVATAGSAVVFAGLTVMIALAGLAVARIPFLTVMGVTAVLAVAVAVVVALTLLPAITGLLGARLAPRAPRPSRRGRARGPRRPGAVAMRWVRAVTRWPVVTVVVMTVGLLAAAVPALDLRLALPDAGSAERGTPARETYDLLSEEFGPGFNGPLIVTADIVASTDPLGLVEAVAEDVRGLDGVAAVPVATPNAGADTMIVQVVPQGGPASDETRQLVQDLRDLRPAIEAEHGVSIAVTGATAVAIDISDLLMRALLPFVVLVVGLSLVLLAMVFRSVWVPVKAAVGYLLSIGAALGAVVAVYQWGWLEGPLHTVSTGPVISFMPILLLGILFGLAMDYEVFLVSRMREHHVHGEGARTAVRTGFASAGKVVAAAAVIMFAVFAAFVPEGDATLQPIALGLAVGVFVDAFLVRMTLVPAVMTLLGERAWWLPRWLDRLLPSFDVEGEGIAHQLRLADWPAPDAGPGVYAAGLEVRDPRDGASLLDPLTAFAAPGTLLVAEGEHPVARTALALVLAGRTRPSSGDVKVAGAVLPQQAGAVRRAVALVRVVDEPDPVAAVLAGVAGRRPARVVVVENLEHAPGETRQGVVDALAAACRVHGATAVVTVSTAAAARLVLPDDVGVDRVPVAASGPLPSGSGGPAGASSVPPDPSARPAHAAALVAGGTRP